MNTLHKIVNGVSVPLSKQEILGFQEKEARYQRIKKAALKTQYKQMRWHKNPAICEQLDAIWQHLQYCRDTLNQPLHPETNLMLEKILSIKAQYPKPEAPV